MLSLIVWMWQLQLNQSALGCYLSARAPIELPPDSLRFDVALIKRHAARMQAVFVRPPRWLIAAQLGACPMYGLVALSCGVQEAAKVQLLL